MPESVSLAGVKVMVIDASHTIRRSAEIFLKQAGAVAILVEDGFDALSRIVDHEPDVIVVDGATPRLDGYQTTALVKMHPQYRSIPVVMLSAKDGLFDRARARLVGADEFITKPFTKDALLKAIAAHLPTPPRAPS